MLSDDPGRFVVQLGRQRPAESALRRPLHTILQFAAAITSPRWPARATPLLVPPSIGLLPADAEVLLARVLETGEALAAHVLLRGRNPEVGDGSHGLSTETRFGLLAAVPAMPFVTVLVDRPQPAPSKHGRALRARPNRLATKQHP